MAQAPKISYGKISATGIKKAIGKFNKTYYKNMQVLMRGGIRAFVQAAVNEIHVDSGMSAASLQPLAIAAGTGILKHIFGAVPRQGQTNMAGRYYRSRKRSIEEGIKAGMNAYQINYGTLARPKMFLTFKTNVYQYAKWEGELWDSIIPGVKALTDYIFDNFDKYFPHAAMWEAMDLNDVWDIN